MEDDSLYSIELFFTVGPGNDPILAKNLKTYNLNISSYTNQTGGWCVLTNITDIKDNNISALVVGKLKDLEEYIDEVHCIFSDQETCDKLKERIVYCLDTSDWPSTKMQKELRESGKKLTAQELIEFLRKQQEADKEFLKKNKDDFNFDELIP